MELEAGSLYRAVFAYGSEQVCGTVLNRQFPVLRRDTIITVTVDGKPEVHTVVYGTALDWANRVADESARRQKAKQAECEKRRVQRSTKAG